MVTPEKERNGLRNALRKQARDIYRPRKRIVLLWTSLIWDLALFAITVKLVTTYSLWWILLLVFLESDLYKEEIW